DSQTEQGLTHGVAMKGEPQRTERAVIELREHDPAGEQGSRRRRGETRPLQGVARQGAYRVLRDPGEEEKEEEVQRDPPDRPDSPTCIKQIVGRAPRHEPGGVRASLSPISRRSAFWTS